MNETWKRRLLFAGVGVGGVVVVIATVSYMTRPDPSLTWAAPADAISLVAVPGGVAAESLLHGPRVRSAGRAAGFSHNGIGAALAASNLAPRVSMEADPAVAEATLREQCYGDPAAVLAQLRTGTPDPDLPAHGPLTPRALYFRILAGDPGGERVVVSLLAETLQAASRGGLARVDVTLRWSGGDWRLRVPLPRPAVHVGTAGYTLLGHTP